MLAIALYRLPYKKEEIRIIANKCAILTLEDNAEAVGSSLKEKLCAGFGEVSILSFNGSKIISTSRGSVIITHKSIKRKSYFSTHPSHKNRTTSST